MFNTLSAEVIAFSTKRNAYSIKPTASIEIPHPAAAEDVTKNVPEFIHYPKSGKFFVSTANLAKQDEKTRFRCLVRKLGPIEYERCSKFTLSKEFHELCHFETLSDVFKRSLGYTKNSSFQTNGRTPQREAARNGQRGS
ncbi:hypothetical protein ACTXT7_006953 [Hymenolepis weldensis]